MPRVLPLLSLLLGLGACGDTDDTDDAEDSTGSAELAWYTTCGDPVCGGYRADAHTHPPCSAEAEGAACEAEGAGCDLEDDCNAELVCASDDPKDTVGGCPISLRSAKAGIRYLQPADARALHDELMGLRLAGYRYKGEPATDRTHLGFLIDDQRPDSPMVRPSGERVDLYGYTSMAVAALQVQDAQLARQRDRIATQEARIAALEARLAALEADR